MIGVLIFPDFQLLDAAGPISVFEIAGRYAKRRADIKMIAATPGPVRSSSGVEMLARKFGSPNAISTLLIAGGEGVDAASRNPCTLKFVRAVAKRGVRVASVCSGAIILAEAGLAVETLFNDFLRQSFEMLMPPGYTSIGSMHNFIRNRGALGGGKRLTADDLIRSGTALIGSPRTVLAGIERMRERTGFGILVALLQFGVLSDDLTRRNMDLFATEVMPHLRD